MPYEDIPKGYKMAIRRLVFPLLVALLLQVLALSGASAQATPEFKAGFATLASMIPDVVGTPLENERYSANGDSVQRTTTGLMVWRKADNFTAFTDGNRTWVNGPLGLQVRPNSERFPWEGAPGAVLAAPPPAPAPAVSADVPQTVVAWSPLIQGQKLRDSLSMAYGAAPDWRQFADEAARRETPVRWAELSPGIGGVTRTSVFRGNLNVQIRLNSDFQEQPTQVVAAVLAHETYHAATGERATSGEACFQNEISAYRWQAYVWQLLPRPAEGTRAVAEQDRVARAVNTGQIESFVRNSPSYQEQCAGR